MPKYNLEKSQKIAKNIEGNFKNASIDSLKVDYFDSFWSHLSPFDEDREGKFKGAVINIKILDKNKIQFSLILNNNSIESKIFPYDVDEDKIICAWNEKWKGIPVLCYKYHEEELELSLDKNNNLVLVCNGRRSAGILILAHGIDINEIYRYSKIK